MDGRSPRDGRVLEQLGTYDPMIGDVDARAVLVSERIQYWLGVGARPSDKVKVLIKKYGAGGTHVAKQKEALDRLAQSRRRPTPIQREALPASEPVAQPAAEQAAQPAPEQASE
jgi:small subunit ribosomal protein S16